METPIHSKNAVNLESFRFIWFSFFVINIVVSGCKSSRFFSKGWFFIGQATPINVQSESWQRFSVNLRRKSSIYEVFLANLIKNK